MMLLAWRWSFTARRIGAEIRFGTAWREYYVTSLLNQVLPGGVAGDFARVVRHTSGRKQAIGPIARSVVLERMVGQMALWLVLLTSAVLWGLGGVAGVVGVALLAALLLILGAIMLTRRPRFAESRFGGMLTRFMRDLRTTLWGFALALQILVSVVIVGLMIAEFYCCAHAVAVPITPGQAVLVVPWVLAATTLPLTVGGWGVREATAAGLFELAAMPGGGGTAAAVVFGAVSLLSAAPGLVYLLLPRPGRDKNGTGGNKPSWGSPCPES
jgi:uncharacterized membrane protein YbhN (UPF0104 family)